MKKPLLILSIPLLLVACEQAKETGDETAREITGSNMIKQGKQVQKQLDDINRQQHLKPLDQQ